MKLAVLHVNSSGENSTSPTMRICRFVANHLSVPLIHDLETAAACSNIKFDVLLVKFGVLKFSNHRDDALKIYANAGRIVNLENDYSFKADPRFRKLDGDTPPLVWSTVPDNVAKYGGKYVNWNVLTWMYPRRWKEGHFEAPPPAKPRVLYYGAYRPNRLTSFQHFFGDHADYPITFGCRSTHIKKFQALNPKAQILNFREPTQLQAVGPALYLEDEPSHNLYCSLANRFFECLQLGIPQLLDAAGYKTYQAAKLPGFNDFMVQNVSEIKSLLHGTSYTAMRDHQLKLWYRDFDARLSSQLNAARAAL